jgi:starch-binding outer membrane protein, SusD/RagB family
MTYNVTARGRGKGLRLLSRVLALGAFTMPLAACDIEELLAVPDPDFATPVGLASNDEGVKILAAGALGDFTYAFAAGNDTGNEGYVLVSALFGDEIYAADTFTDRIAMDRRQLQVPQQGNRSDLAFRRFHQARRQINVTLNAAAARPVNPLTAAQIGRLRALEAYTHVLLGEGWCGALPFSESIDEEVLGEPQTTTQVFEGAIAKFDAALAIDAGSSLARIGKARALLNLNQPAAAAAAVAGIPTSYAYVAEHSANSSRQQNQIFGLQNNNRFSQSNVEGINGIAYRTDPRNPESAVRVGFDGSTPMYQSLIYNSFDADIQLASGVEARLIEAEAAMRAGTIGTFIDKLNEARVARGMPADLVDPGTAEARVSLLFAERGYNLFLTGHRLGDLRRMIRQYGRAQTAVYPTGAHHLGGVYGADVVFSVPFAEENNPNYDPNLCSTTTA